MSLENREGSRSSKVVGEVLGIKLPCIDTFISKILESKFLNQVSGYIRQIVKEIEIVLDLSELEKDMLYIKNNFTEIKNSELLGITLLDKVGKICNTQDLVITKQDENYNINGIIFSQGEIQRLTNSVAVSKYKNLLE